MCVFSLLSPTPRKAIEGKVTAFSSSAEPAKSVFCRGDAVGWPCGVTFICECFYLLHRWLALYVQRRTQKLLSLCSTASRERITGAPDALRTFLRLLPTSMPHNNATYRNTRATLKGYTRWWIQICSPWCSVTMAR